MKTLLANLLQTVSKCNFNRVLYISETYPSSPPILYPREAYRKEMSITLCLTTSHNQTLFPLEKGVAMYLQGCVVVKSIIQSPRTRGMNLINVNVTFALNSSPYPLVCLTLSNTNPINSDT